MKSLPPNQCVDSEGGALRRLDATNAYELRYDEATLSPLRALYGSVVMPHLRSVAEALAIGGSVSLPADGRYALHPRKYGAQLLWLSSNNEDTHRVFLEWFEAAGISTHLRDLVEFDHRIVMYAGFFIVSFEMPEPKWHVDFFHGAEAFTLLTPLFELEPSHGGLLYKNEAGSQARYGYQRGKALLIADGFRHSTEPYARHPVPRVLLSLTAGSDRVACWPVLQRSVGKQSSYLVLPCGHVYGTCGCLEPVQAVASETRA